MREAKQIAKKTNELNAYLCELASDYYNKAADTENEELSQKYDDIGNALDDFSSEILIALENFESEAEWL